MKIQCDQCNSLSVSSSIQEQTFNYGFDEYLPLTALVPVFECSSCGFAYTDGDAEEIRHNAICYHFGVLTPKEIKAGRESKQLSIEELALQCKIPSPLLERFETATLIQSKEVDDRFRSVFNGY